MDGGVARHGVSVDPSAIGCVADVEQVDGDSVHISEGGSGFRNGNSVVFIHSGVISAKSPGATFWYSDDGSSTRTTATSSDGGGTSSSSSSATSAKWTCAASSSDGSTSDGSVNVEHSGGGWHAKPEDSRGIARQMIASGYKEWDNDTDWQALVWIWGA